MAMRISLRKCSINTQNRSKTMNIIIRNHLIIKNRKIWDLFNNLLFKTNNSIRSNLLQFTSQDFIITILLISNISISITKHLIDQNLTIPLKVDLIIVNPLNMVARSKKSILLLVIDQKTALQQCLTFPLAHQKALNKKNIKIIKTIAPSEVSMAQKPIEAPIKAIYQDQIQIFKHKTLQRFQDNI